MFTTLTGLAALSFSIGGYFMKLSAGLTHLRPTVLMFAFLSVGAVLQTVAMRGEQMAIISQRIDPQVFSFYEGVAT